MDEVQRVTWLAGLFEGEGSFTFLKGRPKRLSISMTDLDVLEKVQQFFGGTIYVLTTRKEHWKQAWLWVLTGKDSVELCVKMLPYLGTRRQARCEEYINTYLTKEQHQSNLASKKSELLTQILELREQGLTHKEIALRLNKDRTYITKLLNTHGVRGQMVSR